MSRNRIRDELAPAERELIARAADAAEREVASAGFDLDAGLAHVRRQGAMPAEADPAVPRGERFDNADHSRGSIRGFLGSTTGALTVGLACVLAAVAILTLPGADRGTVRSLTPPVATPSSAADPTPGTINEGLPRDNPPARTSTARPDPGHAHTSGSASATASIRSPSDGFTTTAGTVRLSFDVSPARPDGWRWYVVVQPRHHTTSDFLIRIPPGVTSIDVGVGPRSGGSGAFDDYVIRLALVDESDASRIGGYSDTRYAPDGTRYFDQVTVHRRPG